MGRGTSKAGANAGKITQFSTGGLKSLQAQAKGTPAEEWYNESGQSYEQLKAMENIYDISGNLNSVRGYKDIQNNPDLVKAKQALDDAPIGTVVTYETSGEYLLMKKGNSGQWQSTSILKTQNKPVFNTASMKKYNDIQALNTFTKLQKGGGMRRTLSGDAFKEYQRVFGRR